MIGRLVIVSLLAPCLTLGACKKKDNAGDPPTGSTAPGSSTTGAASPKTPTTPTGDKRVTDSNGSTEQKGPGFTVNAPGPATIEKVAAKNDVRAFERYTFHKTELETYVVEITEIPEDADLGMTLNNMRMVLTSSTQSVRHEDLIDSGEKTGDVTGRDIWYIIDQDDHALRARSKLLGKGHKIYEIRGVSPKSEEREVEAEKFVDSFAFAP